MAYDFDTTDKITTGYSSHATQRTYLIWGYIDGAGGGNRGRLFEKRVAGVECEVFYYNTTDAGQPFVEYDRDWDASTATRWTTPTSSAPTGQWNCFIITYDAGSTSNDPAIWINGSSQSLTEVNAPSGNVVTNSDAYVIGSRGNDTARVFDGKLAEFAIWDRILSDGEIASLSDGYSPLFFSNSLVSYCPLIRDLIDIKNSTITNSGAVAFAHPRIIYPSKKWLIDNTATGGGGGELVKDLIMAGMIPFARS